MTHDHESTAMLSCHGTRAEPTQQVHNQPIENNKTQITEPNQ